MARIWSPQQTNFIDWYVNGKGSCNLVAVAGAGKSTTLVEAASRRSDLQTAIIVFAKKNALDLESKTKEFPWISTGTVHSFGNKARFAMFPKAKLDVHKLRNIIAEIVPENYLFSDTVQKLVSMAKNRAFGVLAEVAIENDQAWREMAEKFDLFSTMADDAKEEGQKLTFAEIEQAETAAIGYAKKALRASASKTDTYDFDDMIYMPLVHKARVRQFDVVMIDEAQDTNPARRALARMMLKKGGRLVAVGDPHQAIMGFTGADNDALDQIKADFNCIEMPLTVTYRCPKAVVEFSREWVSHITAHESAAEGKVHAQNMGQFFARKDLDKDTAVLSRTTAPLVELAFQLLRNKIPCKVEGKDIGGNIKKLLTRWKRAKTLNALEKQLDEYKARETAKHLARKNEQAAASVDDMVQTAKVIIDACREQGKDMVADAVAFVDAMFADEVRGMMVLSTIHKSKGREWKRVFWLDRQSTCPSKWARQSWQMDQEINLMYVAATRSMGELVDLFKE